MANGEAPVGHGAAASESSDASDKDDSGSTSSDTSPNPKDMFTSIHAVALRAAQTQGGTQGAAGKGGGEAGKEYVMGSKGAMENRNSQVNAETIMRANQIAIEGITLWPIV